MSTLRVDSLRSDTQEFSIPTSELRHRVLKTYRESYRSGSWVPGFTYSWLPAGFVDYTPVSSSSRIRFNINLSYAYVGAHCIVHCIFYANGVERGRHSISGHYQEHRHLYVWDVPSWGTFNARIGYQVRGYGSSNNGRFHGTGYWDGGGSVQAAQSEIVLEEYTQIP